MVRVLASDEASGQETVRGRARGEGHAFMVVAVARRRGGHGRPGPCEAKGPPQPGCGEQSDTQGPGG
eukprot:6592040-Alexandrium_andersonii.AAC.1